MGPATTTPTKTAKAHAAVMTIQPALFDLDLARSTPATTPSPRRISNAVPKISAMTMFMSKTIPRLPHCGSALLRASIRIWAVVTVGSSGAKATRGEARPTGPCERTSLRRPSFQACRSRAGMHLKGTAAATGMTARPST